MLLELDGDFSRTFDRLINDEFVGDYSLRSVSTKCPMYWFDNCITGPVASSLNEPHSYHCCWNGPVWPFAVSLVLDSLGNAMGDNVQMKNLFCRIFRS
jgi:glycogen debranching enzyme